MKLYLAALAFMREDDDAELFDYLVAAVDYKAARELVKGNVNGSPPHLFFELGELPSVWHPMCVVYEGDSVPKPVSHSMVPISWLEKFATSITLGRMQQLNKAKRRQVYEWLSVNAFRCGTGASAESDLRNVFFFGHYELAINESMGWEHGLAKLLAELDPAN